MDESQAPIQDTTNLIAGSSPKQTYRKPTLTAEGDWMVTTGIAVPSGQI